MHEDSKIEEAEYFLLRIALVAPRDPTATRFELSALITAARSALQYAREEAIAKPGGQAWYDSAVAADPVVSFLKDTRDINIHKRPLPMRTNITIGVGPAVLSLSSTRTVVVTSGTDERVMEWPEPSPQLPPRPSTMEPPATTYKYQFKEWPGSEDVSTLCNRYLAEIKRIVSDGRTRGFLTG